MGDYIVEFKEEAIKMLKTALKEGAMIKGNFRYALLVVATYVFYAN